jgi:hypothetical protein
MPMTSSVAVSNFENLATLDINNPTAATSNYVVPHRFTLQARYATELFGDNTTVVTLRGIAAEGKPQSYVMNSSDLEGDGFYGRHLLYIPTGLDDPNVIFGEDFDTTAFFDWAAGQGFGPGFVGRNATHAKWSTRFDFMVFQDIPTWDDRFKGRAFLKIYNLGNLLNDDWGKQYNAQFFSVEVVDASIDSETGQYIYETFSDRDINDLLETRSLWEAKIGIEFNFN